MPGRLLAALAAAVLLVQGAWAEPVTLRIGDATGAASPVYRFGGGVWRVPKAMRLGEPALLALGEGGQYRAALAWEVLAPAQNLEDLSRLLANYPLNRFLADRARAGGQIVITLDAMPRWLSSDPDAPPAADGPGWARAGTADAAGWAEVAERVARHFHALGIDAVYEVWNEPDHSLAGGFEAYMKLYRATVVGVRRADPDARVAGPALSDWTARAPDGERYIRAFYAAAAATPAPEAGLDRLPVDAVTYHAFARAPATHHARVADEIRSLAAEFGYADPEILCTEWNLEAAPPYPEGDLNAGIVGAAHVGAALVAMDAAGVSAQTFQMAFDPGTPGYTAGVLSAAATPRAAYEAFRLAAQAAAGERLEVDGATDTLAAAAFRDGRRLRVLVAAFQPTDRMRLRDSMEPTAIAAPGLFTEITSVAPESLRAFFRGGSVPAVSRPAREALLAGRESYARSTAGQPGEEEIVIELPHPMRLVSHLRLDAETAPLPEEVSRQDSETVALLEPLYLAALARLEALPPASADAYSAELERRLDGRAAMSAAPPADAAALAAVDSLWFTPVAERLAATRARADARLQAGNATVAGRRAAFTSAPYAVHLLTFEDP
ncbi:MAG TPA: hypothetical protein VFN28_02180 [Amaricoccus sp.]|nr:hypothetical protein [Amaricoccus sp.]